MRYCVNPYGPTTYFYAGRRRHGPVPGLRHGAGGLVPDPTLDPWGSIEGSAVHHGVV